MKKIALLSLLTLGLLALPACVTKEKQVLEKSTVFGFQAKTPGANGTSLLVQVGLVRNEYWSNPTSSNTVYAAPYNTVVHANLAPLNQAADEYFGTYQLPTNAFAQPAVSVAVPAATAPGAAVSTNKP